MPVRDATPDDVGDIRAMIVELAEFEQSGDEVECTVDDLRRHLFGDDGVAWALIAEPAEHPGTVAGMALYYRTFSTWEGRAGIWLEDLVVRSPWRRQGLAGELLEELRRRSAGRVEWAVLDWNEGAIRFYDGLGARPVDGWTRYRWLRTNTQPVQADR